MRQRVMQRRPAAAREAAEPDRAQRPASPAAAARRPPQALPHGLLGELLDRGQGMTAQRMSAEGFHRPPPVTRLPAGGAPRMLGATRPVPALGPAPGGAGVIQLIKTPEEEEAERAAAAAAAASSTSASAASNASASIPAAAAASASSASAPPATTTSSTSAATASSHAVAASSSSSAAASSSQNFDKKKLLFGSRKSGASPSQGSLYFEDGTRIRLEHDHGPVIDRTKMDRFTFRRNEAKGRFYRTRDYEAKVKEMTSSRHSREAIEEHLRASMLKDAELGDRGNLFEVEKGQLGRRGARTHKSRGKPVENTGIENQAHLDSIARIAGEAGAELEPLRKAQAPLEKARDRHDDAKAAFESADRAHRRARDAHGEAARALADAPYQAAHEAGLVHEEAGRRLEDALTRRRETQSGFLSAGEHLNEMEQRHGAAETKWKERIAHHSARIRDTFGPAASASAPPPGPRESQPHRDAIGGRADDAHAALRPLRDAHAGTAAALEMAQRNHGAARQAYARAHDEHRAAAEALQREPRPAHQAHSEVEDRHNAALAVRLTAHRTLTDAASHLSNMRATYQAAGAALETGDRLRAGLGASASASAPRAAPAASLPAAPAPIARSAAVRAAIERDRPRANAARAARAAAEHDSAAHDRPKEAEEEEG